MAGNAQAKVLDRDGHAKFECKRGDQYLADMVIILVVAGNAQAKVLDRDGHAKFECKRGDQYLADMAQTKVSHIFLLWREMLRLKC